MSRGRATQFQMSAIMIDQSEMPALNHSMWLSMSPMFSSAWLTAPLDGVSRNLQTTPTIDGGSIIGSTSTMRMIVRSAFDLTNS